MSFDVNFTAVPSNLNDTVTVPNGYVAEVLFKAGDPVESGAPGYSGSFQASSETETQAGGNPDGMEYCELTGVGPKEGGVLALNHEMRGYKYLMDNARTRDRRQGQGVCSLEELGWRGGK